MLKKISWLTASSLLFGTFLVAQSAPSATRGAVSLSAGVEVSSFNPDWGCISASPFACWDHDLIGVAVVVDADHLYRRIGAEAEARWLHWGGPGGGLVQSNYLLGPRYPVVRLGGLTLNAKLLVGGSWTTLTNNIGHGSYFTLAPGATLEYPIWKKLVVRGDYEYQMWPSFSGIPGLPNHGLTPNGFSVGMKYRLAN